VIRKRQIQTGEDGNGGNRQSESTGSE